MKSFYDYMEEDPIAKIEYSKGLYNDQVHKVEKEEYIKNLLFADYVGKVKRHQSRYDFIENVIKEAQSQVGKKKRKEREQLSVLENFIREDFFNGDNSFKITHINSGGYESYYYSVELEGYGQTVIISIPMMSNINVQNFEHAYKGMFAFSVKESQYCQSIKKMSYKIEDVAEYIKEYFELGKVNNDEY